ncbi:hypothetical protein KXD93_08380 [Mucilaginibacter sp. BJC16-A38]|uniref:hypothetical protein n=1 Tax=Mucilaginibacter phenanthrenivorans TaxID=1234842 RepID=UPI0021580AE9|nr:hypothetical protein [Mucilaginibacter phenanthrenivorans]MCR8557656.1 hypothetical protein [Mucilaginibacter phenanthrenivorans]
MFGKLFGADKQKEFWKWFTKHQEELYHFEDNQEELFDGLSQKLKQVNNNLVFEFSPIREGGVREFSISADGIKASFPDVIALIEKAPELINWEFYAFRQRIPGDTIQIKMGPVKLGYTDIFFRYGEENNKIGIELNIRNYDPENNTFKNAAFILLDGLIGEYDMETRISWIDFVALDEANIENLYPLTYLRDLVDLSKV